MKHSDLVTLKGGAEVSRLGLGTAQLGGLFSSVTERDSQELIDFAVSEQISYFDTAPHYGKGVSEKRLGKYLSQHSQESWTISTKVGRLLIPVTNSTDEQFADADTSVERFLDYSGNGIRQSFEESLERLGVDTVDIIYIHDPDDFPDQALNEAYPELEKMRSEGLVKSIGLGMNFTEIPTRFVRETDIDVVMISNRYTLLDHSADVELLPEALKKGVSVVAVGVFNSGVLANPVPGSHYFYGPASDEILSKAQHLQNVLADFKVSLPQAALQYPLRHASVKSVVVGCRSKESLKENIANFNAPISEEAWDALAEAMALHQRAL
jgi:D-threo-aldose 1-dehydrogenase